MPKILMYDPISEFQHSPYFLDDDNAPTLLCHLSAAFKGAIRSAALNIPGAAKLQIGRLCFVEGTHVPIWGIPYLKMDSVRVADASRPPDVRARCVLRHWCAEITVVFMKPLLTEAAIANLVSTAGLLQGVGDWRPGKGNGNFGQFRIVARDDPEWLAIKEAGGRQAQLEAMRNPKSYDAETDELLGWFYEELQYRSSTSGALCA